MNELKEYTERLFEDIKHIDENGSEFWYARELQKALDYKKWERFSNVIKNAMMACKQSGYNVLEQFPRAGKLSKRNNSARVEIVDYKLSRYACYLIAQNGDSRKKVIALAQAYFAIQTRRQELSEKEYSSLSEDEKRLYQRNLKRKGNYSLNIAAKMQELRTLISFIIRVIKDYTTEKLQMILLKEKDLDIEKIYSIICLVELCQKI